MSSYISPKVKSRKSKIGKGLFAIKEIHKGELIIDFTHAPGKLVTTKEADRLYEKGNDYMIQVDENIFFAASNKREIEDSDFINHSCNPNSGIKVSLKIVAMRDIKRGEEITMDYAMCESSEFSIKCLCGSPRCRKVITGNDWKEKELQRKYKGYFSYYLQKKIAKID